MTGVTSTMNRHRRRSLVTNDAIKKVLLAKRERPIISREGAVSTGSTLLNLACSDHPDCGFFKGAYYYLVGDSTSGKTWLSLSCFAEACLNSHFRDYRLIFDDVEGGAMMDMAYYFGERVAKRLESPALSQRKGPINSDTVESFYYHISDLIKDGRPFIYVLDSQDSLTSEFSSVKFAKQKKAAEEGEEAAGSYGDGKAKYHSEHLRLILAGLRKTESILLILGQTRDNIGMGFDPKTRSGGRALRFYANLEIWTSVAGKIKKVIKSKERTIGVKCLAEVKKNRFTGKTGKDRAVQIPIYYSLGIDDIGSCVDFLVSENHWPKTKEKGIDAHDLLIHAQRGDLIRQIEEDSLERKLRDITGKVWQEIEDQCQVPRKRRYE